MRDLTHLRVLLPWATTPRQRAVAAKSLPIPTIHNIRAFLSRSYGTRLKKIPPSGTG